MAIVRPTLEQLLDISSSLYMQLSADQASEYLALMQPSFDAYDLIDELPDFIPPVRYERSAGYRPSSAHNPLNAWYVRTQVSGAREGKLAGKTVALKDNISLAGVPMMNGAKPLEGFVPSFDATVVTRLLDAGATILGKATCEHYCLSGGSHTSDPAPVHNPYRQGFSSGGSSSGSAALVAAATPAPRWLVCPPATVGRTPVRPVSARPARCPRTQPAAAGRSRHGGAVAGAAGSQVGGAENAAVR